MYIWKKLIFYSAIIKQMAHNDNSTPLPEPNTFLCSDDGCFTDWDKAVITPWEAVITTTNASGDRHKISLNIGENPNKISEIDLGAMPALEVVPEGGEIDSAEPQPANVETLPVEPESEPDEVEDNMDRDPAD